MGVIYCIECIINEKKYIGSTTNWIQRKAKHLSELRGSYHGNHHLQNAWNKYNESNFNFYLIENDVSDEILLDREGYWMKYHKTLDREYGYNLREELGGGARRISEETKQRLRESMKGKFDGENNPMYGISLYGERNGMYGKKQSEESKHKNRESQLGEKSHCYGKSVSEETKQKIRDSEQGEKNHNAKLTESQVIEIIELLKQGELIQREIAELYSVSRRTIGLIKSNETWTHIPR